MWIYFHNLDTRNDKMKRIKFLGLFGFWYNHIFCGVWISYLENQVWFSEGEALAFEYKNIVSGFWYQKNVCGMSISES
jgi:hypothetical protein